jgi:hypothetical protein
MYKMGEILKSDGAGFDIEILDPDGDVICYLNDQDQGAFDAESAAPILRAMAEDLLSHLNR